MSQNPAPCKCAGCADSNNSVPYWIKGTLVTPVGAVPRVATELVPQDIGGAWQVRWGINRMNYQITPGLYGVGQPGVTAPVFVSANYKLSFDHLRRGLKGLDAWILVLDTKGINVWCAAFIASAIGCCGLTLSTERPSGRAARVCCSQRQGHVRVAGASGTRAQSNTSLATDNPSAPNVWWMP